MLNIVIPMAGAGSRFAQEGYKDPKPLIPINGIPMIKFVIDNLRPLTPHRFIFICQRVHVADYKLTDKLTAWAPGCEVLQIDGVTEGAACTVLTAKKFIDNDDELMIANSDQYVELSIDRYIKQMSEDNLDGLIMTMTADDPKWSFVGLDEQRLVTTVAEKEVISSEATVGIYNFKHGSDFVRSAEALIAKNLRVNGEFYVAPTYNQLIEEGKHIGIHNVGSVCAGMYGLGTPADLNLFLALPVSQRVTGGSA
ncbi:dTDP-glucose pyrophosphorylase [Undibacterium sp. GrIS 1.8]|uniref:glycosyltransferase family 2 protein n=1 Tax=Undibacterium sp. GrIS 1.8 TaxID=3143934 RepID=UPI003391CDEA